MAALSDLERLHLYERIMREFSDRALPCGIKKPELRAAVNAADQWIDDNASSFNAALPQPARGTLSAKQKALILMLIIARRFDFS
jgi:hypothetical protein